MWPDVHLQIQVTGAPAARRSLALAGQPDELTVGHPGGDRNAHGVRTQLQRAVRLELWPFEVERARAAAESLLQVNIDPRMMIPPGGLALPLPSGSEGAPAPKERREEVAEAFLLEYVRTAGTAGAAAAELEAARPVGRRPELLTRLPLTAELVVRGALLRVFQDFVRLL